MENKSATGSANRKVVLGLALFLAAAGFLAVYGNLMSDGNVGQTALREGSGEIRARLVGLNIGDVAALP
ncbi:MAG: hypothetical protein R3D29_14540 [Nitratireductor sp.]